MNANENTDRQLDEQYKSGISIYDEAFRDKLVKVFPNVIIAPPEKAFERSEQNGKVELPLISLYRMSNPIDLSDFNMYEAFVGKILPIDDNENDLASFLMEKSLSMTINYQLDIWAQWRSHADGLFREVVYYLLRYPNLEIKIPEFGGATSTFALRYLDMDQPTDYDSFEDKNVIHRYTLNYEVPRAKLFYKGQSFYNTIKINTPKLILQSHSDDYEIEV